MKTKELEGAALAWAVAKAKGIADENIVLHSRLQLPGEKAVRYQARVSVRWLSKEHTSQETWTYCDQTYSPSTVQSEGAQLIDDAKIATWYAKELQCWCAQEDETHCQSSGTTRLEAGLRCLVAIHLGEEVDIPEELLC